MHFYLKSEQSVVLRVLDKDDKEVKAWTMEGKSGVNTTCWDLTPQEQRIRKGVYEPALRLVGPGLYKLEIKAGDVLLSENIEVSAPKQVKVGN